MKAWNVNNGTEVTREEPVGLKDSVRSVIDLNQQREGGKSADRNPKGYVPELFVLTVCHVDP